MLERTYEASAQRFNCRPTSASPGENAISPSCGNDSVLGFETADCCRRCEQRRCSSWWERGSDIAWRGRLILLIAVAVAVGGACATPPVHGFRGEPRRSTGLTGIASVSTGERHSCALRTDGTALCWGSNRFGEFGNGHDGVQDLHDQADPRHRVDRTPSRSRRVWITPARSLSDGTASCWGANAQGQLGDGTLSSSLVPTPVTGLTNAVAIAAGGHDTCALLDDGHVSCWGANTVGQLGNGSIDDSSTPTMVDGIDDATAISVGTWTACAIRTSGIGRVLGLQRILRAARRRNDGNRHVLLRSRRRVRPHRRHVRGGPQPFEHRRRQRVREP